PRRPRSSRPPGPRPAGTRRRSAAILRAWEFALRDVAGADPRANATAARGATKRDERGVAAVPGRGGALELLRQEEGGDEEEDRADDRDAVEVLLDDRGRAPVGAAGRAHAEGAREPRVLAAVQQHEEDQEDRDERVDDDQEGGHGRDGSMAGAPRPWTISPSSTRPSSPTAWSAARRTRRGSTCASTATAPTPWRGTRRAP